MCDTSGLLCNNDIGCNQSHPVSLSPASYLAKGKNKVCLQVDFDQGPVHKHLDGQIYILEYHSLMSPFQTFARSGSTT